MVLYDPGGESTKVKSRPNITRKPIGSTTVKPKSNITEKKVEVVAKEDKRPDKTISHFENKFFKYLVVKEKLNTFLRTGAEDLGTIIRTHVKTMNHMLYLAYLLLNFHFIRIIEDETINFTQKKIEQNELYQAFAAVSTLNGKFRNIPESDWNTSVLQFRQILNNAMGGKYSFPDRARCGNLINNCVQQMLVAINNHLELNFESRLAKYLRQVRQEDDAAKTHYLAQRILHMRELSDTYPCKFDSDPDSEQIIKDYQTYLKITDTEPKICQNIDIYLPFYRQILLLLKEREKKLFSLLPLKGELIPGHIKICNSVLYDLIGHQTMNKEAFNKVKEKVWSNYFNLNLVETSKHRFDYEITTNGYDVSILLKIQIDPYPSDYNPEWTRAEKKTYIDQYYFQKKKETEEKKQNQTEEKKLSDSEIKKEYLRSMGWDNFEWNDYDVKIAADTGRRRLYSATTGDGPDAKTFQCTGKEWCHLTDRYKVSNKINQRKDESKLIKSLCEHSFKTGSITEFTDNLMGLIPKLDQVIDFYGKPFYHKVKFSNYIKRQKAYDRIVKRFQIGTNNLVCFGDGSVNSNGACKGAKVPVKGLCKRLNREKNIRAGFINEHNTTKICSECYHEMKKDGVKCKITVHLYDGSSKEIMASIYGLRRCSNNECRITWDRDHNARINIFRCMVSVLRDQQGRPDYLKTKKTEKIKIKPIIVPKKPVEETNCLLQQTMNTSS